MPMLRRLILILSLILTTTSNSYADCVKCDAALVKCDKLVEDLKAQISVEEQIIAKQEQHIIDLQSSVDKKNEELNSLLKNPYFIGALGIAVGALGAIYLSK